MGYVHCCAGLRKARSFSIAPEDKYILTELSFLEECPVCGHSVLQLTRIDYNNNVSVVRKINEKARKMFEKLQDSILYEKRIKTTVTRGYSSFYLGYSEYGVKKRCYSNLRTMKLGLFENKFLRA